MTRWTAMIAAAALSILPALLAAEGWDCRMTTECFGEEACQSTDYEFSLGALDGGRAPFLLSSIAGERPMTEVDVLDTPDQRAFVSMVQNLSVELFSLYPDGKAHYTVHSADYIVTYRGTCEARS